LNAFGSAIVPTVALPGSSYIHCQLFRDFTIEPFVSRVRQQSLSTEIVAREEIEMALEHRSKPQQILYLLLAFAGLIVALTILARWSL